MPPKLILTLNDEVLSEIPLDSEVMTIGRKATNDLRIDNLAVSGSHAKILAFGNDCFLEDLESTNGTYVNGDRVTKHILSHGDKIVIGKHQLVYDNPQQASGDEEDFEKTMILKPYAPGMGGEAVKPKPSAPTASQGGDDKPKASLQILSGSNVGKKLSLTKALTRLGKPGSQIAAIQIRPQGCYIFNVPGSSGGKAPTLNGDALGAKAVLLKEGDIIEVGAVRMKFAHG